MTTQNLHRTIRGVALSPPAESQVKIAEFVETCVAVSGYQLTDQDRVALASISDGVGKLVSAGCLARVGIKLEVSTVWLKVNYWECGEDELDVSPLKMLPVTPETIEIELLVDGDASFIEWLSLGIPETSNGEGLSAKIVPLIDSDDQDSDGEEQEDCKDREEAA